MGKTVPFSPYGIVPGVQRRRIAGNRFQVPYNVTSSNAGWKLMTRRYHKNGSVPLNNLRVIIPWCYFNPTTGEQTIGNGATITAAIEYPLGASRIPFTLNGSKSMSVADGQLLVSDPLAVPLPPGARYALHNFVDPGAGGFLPYGVPCLGASQSELSNFGSVNDGQENSASATDKTLSGTTANNVGNTSVWEPFLVGEANSFAPCILSVSDSTMIYTEQGSNGTIASGSGDGDGNIGWFQRMCGAAGVDYLCLSQGSTTAAMWKATSAVVRRMSMLSLCTSAVICIGANDLNNTNGATIIANINAFIATLKTQIPRVYVTTMMPKTTSTDNWATVTNQAVNQLGPGTEQCRLNVNSGIRGVSLNGAGIITGHAGIVDLERFCSTTRVSDGAVVWTPNYTNDGVHMVTAQHVAFAASLNANSYI